jgi:hypothetical protein
MDSRAPGEFTKVKGGHVPGEGSSSQMALHISGSGASFCICSNLEVRFEGLYGALRLQDDVQNIFL